MPPPMDTPVLDRQTKGAPRVVYEDDDTVYANFGAIALEMLRLAGIGATVTPDPLGDDVVHVVVDHREFEGEYSDIDPMPAAVALVNDVLEARRDPRRWNQVFEPDDHGPTLIAVLVDAAMLDELMEHQLLVDYIHDPRD